MRSMPSSSSSSFRPPRCRHFSYRFHKSPQYMCAVRRVEFLWSPPPLHIWVAYHRVYLLAIVNIYTRVLRSLLKYYTCTTAHSHHIFIIIFCSRSRTCVSIYLFVMNERARAPKKTRLRANKAFFIIIYILIYSSVCR